MARHALLVVPQLIKYAAGSLLGPAMLAAAARRRGHETTTLDLNIRYLDERLVRHSRGARSSFVGDHDKPVEALRAIQAGFDLDLARHLPVAEAVAGMDPRLTLTVPFEAVHEAARSMARGAQGAWIRANLGRQARPDLLGISVLYSGQVVWGLAASIVGRALWPGIPIVWGGAHVTALRDVIPHDPRFGRYIDGFVFGYAERTFAELLDAIDGRTQWPLAVARAGCGQVPRPEDDPDLVPEFTDLGLYGEPRLNLPIQTSRGCSYGQCSFCTYPRIEGAYRPGALAGLDAVARLAERHGGVVSLKDSLVNPDRLLEVGAVVGGRVPWSACTKLNRQLASRLPRLARLGLDTLELGAETMHPGAQRLLRKIQPLDVLRETLDAAWDSGVGLVINLLYGLPHIDPREEAEWEARILAELQARPGLRTVIERNRFQLERLAPMACDPAGAGLRIRGAWPWASVLQWEAISMTACASAAGGRP